MTELEKLKLESQFKQLTIADDFIFGKVMSRKEIARQFIEMVTGRTITRMSDVLTQTAAKSFVESHGVRFDVTFEGDNTIYDIEMQQTGGYSTVEQAKLLRRVRYYQASMDTSYFREGQQYAELKRTMIIFVCAFDPFGAGMSKYTQLPGIQELRSYLDNGTTVLYLNTKFKSANTTEDVTEFLRYINDTDSVNLLGNPFLYEVQQAVDDAKDSEENRRIYMTMHEKLMDAREEGERAGRDEVISAFMKTHNVSREEALVAIYGNTSGGSKTGSISRLNLTGDR